MTKPKPYILNLKTRRYHRRSGLTERCNTDQIEQRRDEGRRNGVGMSSTGVLFVDGAAFDPCKFCAVKQ